MKQTRRETTLARLESQLTSGVKPEKVNGKTTNTKVKLTDSDVKRINGEVGKLKKLLGKN
jgi:hypothetical protein